MPNLNPVRYNSGTTLDNSISLNQISFGVENVAYGPTILTKWYANTPIYGLIIVSDSYSQGLTTQENSYPIFWGISGTTSVELMDLINGLPARSNLTRFIDPGDAINWLVEEGKYGIQNRTYEAIVVSGLTLLYDAGSTLSYPLIGTTVYDLTLPPVSGNMINGVTYLSDDGGIFDFDSTLQQHISFSDLGTLSNFTVGCWFKLDTLPSVNEYPSIVTNVDIGGNVNFNLGFTATPWDGKITGGFKSSNTWYYPNGFTPITGKWYYVVVSYDGSTVRLYVDGYLYSQTNTSTSAVSSGNGNYIGRGSDSLNYINGKIPIVQIYDTYLTDSEIFQNYSIQASRFSIIIPTPTTTPTLTPTPTVTPTPTLTQTPTPTLTQTPSPTTSQIIPPHLISTWRTTGFSESITLPYWSASTSYDGTIDWGDGSQDVNSFENRTHVYANPGDYEVKIYGTISGWTFGQYPGNSVSKDKILSITQWGPLKLGSLTFSHFYNCTNLILSGVTDVLDLSDTLFLYRTFMLCNNITTINRINEWNTTSVVNIQEIFKKSQFNDNISSWDVSNCLTLNGAFDETLFNQNIGSWNTAKVTNMTAVFSLSPFNQDISSWNVSGVTSMFQMFRSTPFNFNISGWNVSNVTNMGYMFENSQSFNAPIGTWDVSKVTSMISMFSGATSFNQDISTWSVSKVTNMSSMFNNATAFDVNLGSWNVTAVTNFNNFMLSKTDTDFSFTNLDSIYNGWSSQNVKTGITINFGTIKFSENGLSGKQILTGSPYNWIITDGGMIQPTPTPTPTITVTPSLTSTSTPTPTPTPPVLYFSGNSVMFIDSTDNLIYKYEPEDNTIYYLFSANTSSQALDIAVTDNKIFINDISGVIYSYNYTKVPFSTIYDQSYTFSSYVGSGMTAINDDEILISSDKVYRITLSTSNVQEVLSLSANCVTNGDIIYDSILNQYAISLTNTATSLNYINVFSGTGDVVTSINLSSLTGLSYNGTPYTDINNFRGLYTYDGGIYSLTYNLYNYYVDIDYPTIWSYTEPNNKLTKKVVGASNISSSVFWINPAPNFNYDGPLVEVTPTPTPTINSTPTVTQTPNVTPTMTQTVTPTTTSGLESIYYQFTGCCDEVPFLMEQVDFSQIPAIGFTYYITTASSSFCATRVNYMGQGVVIDGGFAGAAITPYLDCNDCITSNPCPSITPTPTTTETPTPTPTTTETPTPTVTESLLITPTPSSTPELTPTPTVTEPLSVTPTPSSSEGLTPTPTTTETPTPTVTESLPVTPTPTTTETPTPTVTESSPITPTPTTTETPTPTVTESSSITPTPSSTPELTPTPTSTSSIPTLNMVISGIYGTSSLTIDLDITGGLTPDSATLTFDWCTDSGAIGNATYNINASEDGSLQIPNINLSNTGSGSQFTAWGSYSYNVTTANSNNPTELYVKTSTLSYTTSDTTTRVVIDFVGVDNSCLNNQNYSDYCVKNCSL